jgi:antitoxin HicB
VLREDDNGTWLVTFPDFDDAVTFGETREQALAHAAGALEAVIIYRMRHKLDVPTPSSAPGKAVVGIPPLIAAKALLYKELRDQKMSIRQLAGQLNCDYPIAHRLLDTSRKTQIDEVAKALEVLGQRVIVGVERST